MSGTWTGWILALTVLLGASVVVIASDDLPLADRVSRAQTGDEQYIHWREHIIDDPTMGVADLSGSDGLVMADLDGDGFEEIISVHESDTVYDGKPVGHVRIAWGTRDPDRWYLTTLASGHEAAAAEDVTTADFNGDGYLDVVVACELAHLIYFENPGSNFRTQDWSRHILDVTTGRGSYIRVFAADFDGDGRAELVAPNKGEQNPEVQTADMNTISIYRPTSAVITSNTWSEQVLGRYRIPINSEPVDLDGDGDIDIVGGSRGERRIFWFENDGAGGFEEHRIVLEGFPEDVSLTGFNMDYADLDGDGRRDIVSTAWPGKLIVLLQPERADSHWSWFELGSAPPDQLVSIRLADIDGDDDLDALSGAYSRGPRDRDIPDRPLTEPSGRIAWFENPGTITGERWRRHDVSRRQRGMFDKWIARDLDGDGDIDFVGTRGNSEPYDGVFWLEQVRSGVAQKVFTGARRADSPQSGLAPAHESR